MTHRWMWITAAVILDGAAALVGGLLPDAWVIKRRAALIGFAAGALLFAAFLDILPAAIALRGNQALWWAAASFTVVAIGEWLLTGRHRHQRDATVSVQPATLLGSDALHNISDGMAISAAFLVSRSLGVVTSLAVVVHEVPEEVGDYVVLRAAGVAKVKALLALTAVQATAAIGAFGVLLAASQTTWLSSIALSIAVGTFLFIAATDLLPDVLRKSDVPGDRWQAMSGFLLGAAVIAVQAAW